MNQTGLWQTRPKSIYRHQIFLRKTLKVGSAVNSDIHAVRTLQKTKGQPERRKVAEKIHAIIAFNAYNQNYMEKPKSLRISKIRICTLILSQEMSSPHSFKAKISFDQSRNFTVASPQ